MKRSWTIEQQRKYRVQLVELGLAGPPGSQEDENRRLLLKRITGKRTTTEIGFDEMDRVISEQEKMLGRGGRRRSGRPRTTQDDLIYRLADELGWHRETGRLVGFLRKQFGRGSLYSLSVAEKGKLIEALKAMRDGGRGERIGRIRSLDEATDDLPPQLQDKIAAFWRRREEALAES